MTKLKIVTYKENPEALTTPLEPYDFSQHTYEERKALVGDMLELMYKMNGLGLSANQCGLPWRVFVMRGSPVSYACFNPRIAMFSDEVVKLDEGCLSFPNLVLPIERSKHGRVRFSDATGDTSSFTFTGLTFRVYQHELMHLDGKMFFDGCSRIHLERAIRQAKKRGTDYSSLGLMRYCKRKALHV